MQSTEKVMKKHRNPLSSTKNFPFSKALVGLKGYYTAYLLGLFVAFEQFGKLAPTPKLWERIHRKAFTI